MSSFTRPLIITPVGGQNWKLVELFEYHVGNEDSEEMIIVPIGFVTDFASIPRLFWSILPPWGKYGKSAIIHDVLYKISNYLYSRKRCDKIFLEGMKVLKVGYIKRYTMYYAVRAFGWRAYKKRAT